MALSKSTLRLSPGRESFDYHPAMPSRSEIVVLIVEDDDDVRRFYATSLQQLGGFTVRQSSDGVRALQSIDIDTPDLVLLDLDLPPVHGLTVQQEIAARTHTRHIPIVVVTGSDADLGGVGMACVLRKPVTAEKLVDTIRRCILNGARRGD